MSSPSALYQPLQEATAPTEEIQDLVEVDDVFVEVEVTDEAANRVRVRMPEDTAPLCPPRNMYFDIFFFRKLYATVCKYRGVGKDDQVHFSVMFNVSVRMVDALQMETDRYLENGFFGRKKWKGAQWFTWQDMVHELSVQGCPKVKLSFTERIMITLERAESSQLATAYSMFMLFVIIGNLTVIVLQSVPEDQCDELFCCEHLLGSWVLSEDGQCGARFQDFCILVFSAEYFTKLVCSPWVRRPILSSDYLLEVAVPKEQSTIMSQVEWRPSSRLSRLWNFLIAPYNLIDLISILPWWLTHTVGRWLPPGAAAAFRVVRIFRVMRIIRTGKYLSMLQVLGVAMINSVSAIVALMLFLFVVALVLAVLLASAEPETFASIPYAGYFIFSELIHLTKAPGVGTPVVSIGGISILSAVLMLKGLLWLLPLGQVKAAFDKADAQSKGDQMLKDSTVRELTRPDWTVWAGLTSSTRCQMTVGSDHEGYLASAFFPMPLLQQKVITGQLDVKLLELQGASFSSCCKQAEPCQSLRFTWTPSPAMQKAKSPAIPDGKLDLTLADSSGFLSGLVKVKVAIPTRLHQQTKTEKLLYPLKATSFDVCWHADGERPSSPSVAGQATAAARPGSGEKEKDATTEMRKQTLKLLQDQAMQLAEQQTRISSIEAMLHESGRRT